jgi:hypothetical protein
MSELLQARHETRDAALIGPVPARRSRRHISQAAANARRLSDEVLALMRIEAKLDEIRRAILEEEEDGEEEEPDS